MVREGKVFLQTSLPSDIPQHGILIQIGNIRSFTRPAYAVSKTHPNKVYQILGYVRATESTVTLEAELRRLRWSLIVGVLTVSGLAALGGIWLTCESLKPVVQSFDQLKQFTSDASHELRNPLTAIRASIAVMQSHPERIHPADVEKLNSMAMASAQMSQLIDNLLLLARMDRQAPDQSGWRYIALDELLEDLVNLYSDRAEQSQISLKFQLISGVEVNGDASQLQQLFMNLLTNALQYTPSGGTVIVSLQRIGTYALVTIQDTGIGIAPEQLPHIFDRFWRADQARSQYGEGSGLGLAIAKTITQRHQGDITVKSKLGEGSCFYVKLPLAR
ncbi:sensor histidine kinase [Leptothermofonsia sp. ETS-13]|uniref:sensor histidine kinase n=1 Tax=Leptothermofonsia sp. ETS-13 TaxID=3035696 RepID=UPI003BA30CBC